MDESREELQEEAVTRVAAIDIAKNSGVVCTRLPHEQHEGKRAQRVWTVPATTNAIVELGDHLICQGVTLVLMEATGNYWRPFFYLLESRGLRCWLVNARHVKNVPGRPKTDKLDAVWLAKLAERGMVRPSFVPPKPVRQLRDFTRTRTVFVHERTRHKQRIDKVLQDAQIRLSSVATDPLGASGRAMMEALIAGERNARSLADLTQGRLTAKRDALIEAMTGQFEDHHGRLLKLLLATVDHLSGQIAVLDQEIAASIDALPDPGVPIDTPTAPDGMTFGRELLVRLDEIPGVGPVAARALLAEIGPDMSGFPSPDHLASWAKLCPRTIQSGAKSTTGPAGKGNPWLKGALGEAASAAARTDTFLGARYRRLVKRRGHAKALVAVARSILVIAWHLVNDPQARYQELGPDWHHKHLNPQRRTRDLVRQLEHLGHTVILAPNTA